MKKLLLSLILLSAVLSCYSQETKFGAKAGVNFANISSDLIPGHDGRTGFFGGFLVERVFNYAMSIQSELLYSQQGFVYSTNSYKAIAAFNYINIPVIFKAAIIRDRLFAGVGPQVGYMIKSKVKLNENGNESEMTFPEFYDFYSRGGIMNPQKFDYGIAAEFSVNVIRHIDVSARYYLGLSNAMKSNGTYSNSVIQIGVGFKL